HDAVVGRDDEHGDVGDLRAARAHRGERLMTRGVEERDLPAADIRLVGADVLSDPAGLRRDHLRLPDRVEQRRLAVVDVTHERDAGFDGRRPGGRRDLALLPRGAIDRTVARALALPRAGAAAAAFDDDPAPALGAAAARSDRSIWFAVGHSSQAPV